MAAAFAFDAIGTRWSIDTLAPLAADVRDAVLALVERFDRDWSRFRPDSRVATVAAAQDGGRFAFPPEAARLFAFYDRLHAASGGAVDPLVGRDLERLGYGRDYALVPTGAARRPACWARDVRHDGCDLVTEAAQVIDVGAAGKGLLVNMVAALLRRAGITDHVVDASGDIRHAGGEPLTVGLEHPLAPGQVIGIANLRDRALCASATTRRRWGDGLHHVIDARTGAPTRDVIATWVVADDAMVADGLATALFFTGHAALAGIGAFEFVRMFADGRAERSAGFDGTLFEASPSEE